MRLMTLAKNGKKGAFRLRVNCSDQLSYRGNRLSLGVYFASVRSKGKLFRQTLKTAS